LHEAPSSSAVEAMKLVAADFFEKPFDGDKMVTAVQSIP
jgi:DNA-binding NtrC family response regulator